MALGSSSATFLLWLNLEPLRSHSSLRKNSMLAIPQHITPDREFFTVVRFWGKAPMIGYVDDGFFLHHVA
jgi:hypothetical protein